MRTYNKKAVKKLAEKRTYNPIKKAIVKPKEVEKPIEVEKPKKKETKE